MVTISGEGTAEGVSLEDFDIGDPLFQEIELNPLQEMGLLDLDQVELWMINGIPVVTHFVHFTPYDPTRHW